MLQDLSGTDSLTKDIYKEGKETLKQYDNLFTQMKLLCYNYMYNENNVKEETVLNNLEQFLSDVYLNEKLYINQIKMDNLINMIEIVALYNGKERMNKIKETAERYKEKVRKRHILIKSEYKEEKNHDAAWWVDHVKEMPIYNRIQKWDNIIDSDPDRFLQIMEEKELTTEQLTEVNKALRLMRKDDLAAKIDDMIERKKIIKEDLGSTAKRISDNPDKFINYLSKNGASRVSYELKELFYQSDAKRVEEEVINDLLDIYLEEITNTIENSKVPEAQKLAELICPTRITKLRRE